MKMTLSLDILFVKILLLEATSPGAAHGVGGERCATSLPRRLRSWQELPEREKKVRDKA
jgi:hypothetical protein